MDRRTLQTAPSRLLTPRLELVFPHPRHAAAVMESVNASLSQLGFIRWAREAFDDETSRRFCEMDAEQVAAGECLIYFAFERESGRFVGNLDLHTFDFDTPRCQIGYVGDARMGGRGLMREAALALLDQAFVMGMARVEAWCDARNTRSVHFAQMLGMQREGLMRQVERDLQGELCDQVLLARLQTDPRPA